MSKPNEPEVISLTHEQVDALKKRLLASPLDQSDQKILISSLSFNFWLQTQLARAQLSILKLKNIFGMGTEKKSQK